MAIYSLLIYFPLLALARTPPVITIQCELKRGAAKISGHMHLDSLYRIPTKVITCSTLLSSPYKEQYRGFLLVHVLRYRSSLGIGIWFVCLFGLLTS